MKRGVCELSRLSSSAACSTLGQISSLLLFTFAGGVRIARTVRANVVSADVDSLGPSSPYSGGRGRGARGRGQMCRRDGPNNVVPGEKPSRLVWPRQKLPLLQSRRLWSCFVCGCRPKLLRLPHRLKPYPVPEDLWECVCEGEEEEVMHIRPQLTEVYTHCSCGVSVYYSSSYLMNSLSA